MNELWGHLPHVAGVLATIYGGVMSWAKILEVWVGWRLIVLDAVIAVEKGNTPDGAAKKAEAVTLIEQKVDALIPGWAVGIVNLVIGGGVSAAIDAAVNELNGKGFFLHSSGSAATG